MSNEVIPLFLFSFIIHYLYKTLAKLLIILYFEYLTKSFNFIRKFSSFNNYILKRYLVKFGILKLIFSMILVVCISFSLSQIIKTSIACGIFLSYPLNGFVVITVVFRDYGNESRNNYHYSVEFAVRLCFLFLTGKLRND